MITKGWEVRFLLDRMDSGSMPHAMIEHRDEKPMFERKAQKEEAFFSNLGRWDRSGGSRVDGQVAFY